MKGGIDMWVGRSKDMPGVKRGYNVVRHRQPGKTLDYLYLTEGDIRVVEVRIVSGHVPIISINGIVAPTINCAYTYVTSTDTTESIMHITADVLDIKGNVIRIDKDISNEADR